MDSQQQQLVTQVEEIARWIYSGESASTAETVQWAMTAAQELRTDVEKTAMLLATISFSEETQALILAAKSLKGLMAVAWPYFDSVEKVDFVYKTLMHAFVGRSAGMESGACNGIAATLCFFVKSGFAEYEQLRGFTGDLAVSLRPADNPSIPSEAELHVMSVLLEEIESVNQHRLVSHHRTMLKSFRDHPTGLQAVYQLAMDAMLASKDQLVNQATRSINSVVLAYIKKALDVLQLVFTFNFALTVPLPDEDPSGQVSFPQTWSHIVCSEETMEVFWQVFFAPAPGSENGGADPNAGGRGSGGGGTLAAAMVEVRLRCLECLIQLSAPRRSLFPTGTDRAQRRNGLLKYTMNVMNSFHGLGEDPEVLREFCRLLNRMKPLHSLEEIVDSPSYDGWRDALLQFTLGSFESWEQGYVGATSLMCLWNRLCKDCLLVSGSSRRLTNDAQLSCDLIRQVCGMYIKTRLEMAHENHESLEDVDLMRFQFQFLATLVRFWYPSILPSIINDFWKPLANTYGTMIQQVVSSGNVEPTAVRQIAAYERQLTLLVYIFKYVLNCSTLPLDYHDQLDELNGCIVAEVLTLLLDVVAARANLAIQSSSPETCQWTASFLTLENSAIEAIDAVRDYCLQESLDPMSRSEMLHGVKSRLPGAGSMNDEDLLVAVLQVIMRHIFEICKLGVGPASTDASEGRLSARDGQGPEAVITNALGLVQELLSSWACTTALIAVPEVQQLIAANQETYAIPFPFIADPTMRRQTLRYRRILTAMLLRSVGKQNAAGSSMKARALPPPFSVVRAYLAPFVQFLGEAAATLNGIKGRQDAAAVVNEPQFEQRLIVLLYELRGILSALTHDKEFLATFLVLVKPHVETFLTLANSPLTQALEVALLRLCMELTANHSSIRIKFEQHSSDGYHLFKMCCAVCTAILMRRCRELPSAGEPIDSQELWSSLAQLARPTAELDFWVKVPSLCFRLIYQLLGAN